MDIVVTIPKSEYKNDDKETKFLEDNPDAQQFWVLKKVPTKLQIGNKIYFVKHGQIESSMIIEGIEKCVLQKCDVTGREWTADCLLWLGNKIFDETGLNIKVKGFQGFRYKWW
jgi:hypothetical protein